MVYLFSVAAFSRLCSHSILKEQSDQGLHCSPLCLYLLETSQNRKITFFNSRISGVPILRLWGSHYLKLTVVLFLTSNSLALEGKPSKQPYIATTCNHSILLSQIPDTLLLNPNKGPKHVTVLDKNFDSSENITHHLILWPRPYFSWYS